MPAKKHSKESIIQTLRNIAARLGKDTLTKYDVGGQLPLSSINRYFGNLGNALDAAGLKRTELGANFRHRGPVLSDDALMESLRQVEKQVGHEPGTGEYSVLGDYSVKPFRDRYGRWSDVLTRYRRWKAEGAGDAEASVRPAAPPTGAAERVVRAALPNGIGTLDGPSDSTLYGEYINFRGLTHAPVNEQGVVFLFGMVSRDLGFVIEALQQGFPDCEGKVCVDPKKSQWRRARIEFEYRASSFREHAHDPKGCDLVVCWENDWPECPVRVVELRTEIIKLSHS